MRRLSWMACNQVHSSLRLCSGQRGTLAEVTGSAVLRVKEGAVDFASLAVV